MHNLEWKKSDKPKATHDELDKLEDELSVKIPEMLRTILTTYNAYPPERNGERAEVVTRLNPETGKLEFVGYFANFTKPYTADSTISLSLIHI